MRKLEVSLLVLSIVALSFVMASEQLDGPVQTNLAVANSSPILFRNISEIQFPKNQNYTGRLNLSNHFVEPNSDKMFFTVTSAENLTIVIDQVSGMVSIYPDIDFIGTRYVIFYASDGNAPVPSNNVTIDVGTDTEAPKWFNPRKSKTTVYQSSVVNFSTDWTDNVQLQDFLFSINQGSGWSNTSWTLFSGVSNRSIGSAQMSAPSPTNIFWRFYARDIFGNINATNIQNFSIAPYPSYPATAGTTDPSSSAGSVSGVGGATRTSVTSSKELSGYSVDVDKLKVSLKQGESTSKSIKITNLQSEELDFNLTLSGLQDLAYISEENFQIPPHESAVITIDFIASLNSTVDEYFGSLLISAGEDTLIPIVVDVNSFESDIELTLNISKEFQIVKQGNPVTAQLKILSLKDLRTFKGNLTYSIKDFQGNIIDTNISEIEIYDIYEENLTLQVPEDLQNGEYLFFARFISNNTVALDSKVFRVGTEHYFIKFLMSFLYLIIALILLFLIIILYLMYRRAKRKRELLELYLMLKELAYHLKEDQIDSALNIYIRIKRTYGQPISNEMLEDKEKLKEEMKKFADRLKKGVDIQEAKKSLEESKEEPKKEIKEETKSPEKPKEESLVEEKPKEIEKPKESKEIKNPEKSKEESADKEEKEKPSEKKEEPKKEPSSEKKEEPKKEIKEETKSPEKPKELKETKKELATKEKPKESEKPKEKHSDKKEGKSSNLEKKEEPRKEPSSEKKEVNKKTKLVHKKVNISSDKKQSKDLPSKEPSNKS